MTTVSLEPRTWSPRQWMGAIGLIFIIQLGFIVALGDRQPIRPRKPSAAPAFQLIGSTHSEWLALTDPTLFALPHARVFSGLAWLKTAPPPSSPFEWTEPPRWLGLPVQLLGASFAQLVANDSSSKWQLAEIPEPQALLPEVSRAPLLAGSTLRLEGGLSHRRLLSQPHLPSWPPRALNPTDTDMLANTVLQVLVDAGGQPVSLTLLGTSGYVPADEFAMSLVTGFQFEPQQSTDPGALLGLSWGQVVFEWQTSGPTNTPAGSP